jgi:aryl-alcohol dehydrogenase-like predicted oxidoreductase
MEHRPLGRTGVKVSPLCLGAMMFGAWGNADHDDCIAIIHAALDAGINFVDTADVYSGGESEQIVGKALQGRRDEVVLATKVHGAMGRDPNMAGNSRRWIVRACEDSLRRLQTDRIDLYQVHRPSPETDIDETLAALSDLQRAGKVLSVGSSTFPPSEIVEAQWAAERRKGTTEMTSSRASRIPWRYDLSIPANQQKLAAADALAQVAEEAGLSLVHLAVAWVANHPAVTAPIIGPRTMEQFKTQIGAADVRLEPAILDRIDEIVPPGTNFSLADSGYQPPAVTDARLRRR